MPDGLSLAITRLAEDAAFLFELRARITISLDSKRDVEDVIQELWVAALEEQPATRQIRAWCRAKAIELARGERRRRDLVAAHTWPLQAADDVAAPDETEESRVPDDLHHEALRRAYSRLAPGDRILLRRRYWLEHSWRKLARDLGVDVASVHRRHRRILRDLRQAMIQPEMRDAAKSAG